MERSYITIAIWTIVVLALRVDGAKESDFVEAQASGFVEVKAEAYNGGRQSQQIRYTSQRRPSLGANNAKQGSKWWCPDRNAIYPCTCDGPQSFTLITCDRLANAYSLYQAFRTHYPSVDIGKLSVTNSRIERLNDGAFGKLRMEYIYLKKNTLKSIELDVLLPSKPSLKRLEIIHNDLDKFPFGNISTFPKLEYLDLHYNSLKTIPDFAFGVNDKLREINLSYNKISYVGSYAFERLYALERLNLRFNKLAVLNNNAFALSRPNPKLHLDLSNNQMVLVSDGAFTNQYPLLLNLSSNALKSFPQAHFKPVLNGMALTESGCIEAYDNRFRCTCVNVGWLVRSPNDMKSRVVGFYCTDVGKHLENLRLYDINCPY